MLKYENEVGDILIVVDEEYIIFDTQDMDLRCEFYDEKAFQKYLDSGYKLSKDNEEKSLIGNCTCKNKIYETNRIKVRDYFECPRCGKVSTRNDLIN